MRDLSLRPALVFILASAPFFLMFQNFSAVAPLQNSAPAAPVSNLGIAGVVTLVDFDPAIYVSLSSEPGTLIRYAIDQDFLPLKCDSTDQRNHILYRGKPVRLYHDGSIWAVACRQIAGNWVSSKEVEFKFAQKPLAGRSFSLRDNVGLPYQFSWQGILPANADEIANSTAYPFSHVRVSPTKIVQASGRPQFASFSANHCNYSDSKNPDDPDTCFGVTNGSATPPFPNTAPNFIQPMFDGGANFRTYRKADTCTMAQTMRLLGKADAQIEAYVASKMGQRNLSKDPIDMILVKEQDLKARNEVLTGLRADPNHYDRNFLLDTCVLPPQPDLAYVKGLWLCAEAHDGRSPGLVRKFFRKWAAMIHAENKLAYLVFDLMNSRLQLIGSGTQGNNQFLLNELDKVNLRFAADDLTFQNYESRFLSYMDLLLAESTRTKSPVVDLRKTYLHIEIANLDGGAENPKSLEAAYALRKVAMKYQVPMVHLGGALVYAGGGPERQMNKILNVITSPAVYIKGISERETMTSDVMLTAVTEHPVDPEISAPSNIDFVQFKIDGKDYGPRLNKAPYNLTLKISKLSPGGHRLRAVIRTKKSKLKRAGGMILMPASSSSSAVTIFHVQK